MLEKIYCAGGNKRLAETAINYNFTYGAQMPSTIYYPIQFADQNWKTPNREKYIEALKEHRPKIATVLDLEHESQFDEVMQWSHDASQYVGETIIIIPKISGIIGQIPETINGKEIRLGYSVPTSFGGSSVPLWEFGRRGVHLLGGSPIKQYQAAQYLNVRSVDGNYAQKIALSYGKVFTVQTPSGIALTDFWQPTDVDVPYLAWELACMNINAMWENCKTPIRWARADDIPAVKKIANQYKNELGFVNSAALKTAILKRELFVALSSDNHVVGFCNWHKRRDGIATIYEIAVSKNARGQNIGRGLLSAIPAKTIRLKCTTDNDANRFYENIGFAHIAEAQGRKRPLNVWQKVL